MTLEEFKRKLELTNQIAISKSKSDYNGTINQNSNIFEDIGNNATNNIPYSSEYKNKTKSQNIFQKAGKWFGNMFQSAKNWEDGYDFGDVTKTVAGSVADAGLNAYNAVAQMAEGFPKLAGAGIAQVADLTGHDKFADAMRKEISDPNNDAFLSPKVNTFREKYIEPYSILGTSSDQVASGVGSTIGASALSVLGGADVGKIHDIPVGMGVAEMGNSVAENYSKEDVTDAQAWLNGAGKGVVSAISESIFGAFGVGGSELDDVLVKNVTKNLDSQLAKGMVQLGIKAGGEAAEEFLEYAGGYLTNLATDYISQGKGAEFYEQWNSDEVLQNMLSAFVSTGITQSGGTVSNLVKGNDVITGNTKQVQAQIDQEVQSQVQELKQKGEKVNTAKQIEIEKGATEKIYLNNAKQELTDIVNKSESIDNSLKNGILSKIDSTEDFNNLNVISKMVEAYENRNKNLTPTNSSSLNATVEKDIAKQTFLDSAKTNNIDVNNNTEVLDSMFEMTYQRGVNISIDDKVFTNENQDALWRVNKETGQREVVINPNNPTKALQSITIHEMTHDMENTQEYQQLSKLVLDYAKQQNNYDSAFKELSNMYAEEYKDYNGIEFESRINQELVADILGEKLGNQEFVNSIVTSNRGVAQNIYSWVVDKLNKVNKLTGYKFEKLYWADVKSKFEKAFSSEFNNIKGGTKYSIQNDTNGNKYIKVDTDQNIFEGIAPKDYGKIAKMYMQDYLMGETKLADNDTAVIDKKGINKYTNPGKFQFNFNEKMKLTPELKNVLSISKKVNTKAPIKSNSKYSNWEYYNFNFEINGNKFSGLINIGIDSNNNKHFYEINNIKRIGVSETSLKESTNPFINNIIPQNQKNINNDIKADILTKDNKGRQLSEQQQEYFKNSKVRDSEGNLLTVYHGTNQEFNIFDINKGGKSNSDAGIGFWFTESQEGAYDFANTNNSLYGGNDEINVKETYLNIKNPKIYETVDNSVELEKIESRLKTIKEEIYSLENKDFYLEENKQEIKWASDKEELKLIAQQNIASKERQEIFVDNAIKYQELIKEQMSLEKEYDNQKYNDAYELFKADIYKIAGKTPYEANLGGTGMYLENNKEILNKFRENLIEEGYDGIIIKDTKYDRQTLGKGKNNNQYIAFNSNQIKNVDNTNPTSNKDIRYSKSNDGDYQRFLQDNFSNNGTKTYMEDIKLPSKISNLKNELRNIVNNSTDVDSEMKDSLLKLINSANTESELQSYKEDLKSNTNSQQAPVKSGTIKINNYKNAKLNSKIVNNALSMVESNKQGRRTKSQWLQVAEQIGMNIKENEIDKYAYKTWSDFLPNQKNNLNRQGEKYVPFTRDEWIKAVNDGYNKANDRNIVPSVQNYVSNDKIKKDAENFAKQVDDVINGTFPKNDMLTLLSTTPKVLQDIGLSNLSITMTQKHLYTIMNEVGKYTGANYHNLGEDIVKQLPEAISNPLDIVESSTRDDSIVLTTYLADSQDRTIVASIKINGKGQVNNIEIDTNVMTSAYGRNNYDKFMKKNIEEGRLLYDIDQGVIKKVTMERLQSPIHSNSEVVSPAQQLAGYTSSINNIISSSQNYVNNTKKTMNPIEIANLSKDDISSTPKFELSEANSKGGKESNFYKNVTNNSKFLNKELRSILKNDTDVKYYQGITNEETLTKAKQKLDDGGQVETIRWANKEKDFTAEDVTEGWILLKRYQDSGDYESAVQIARKMRNIATNAGQTVQAFGIMNRLTPEGMTYYAQMELDEAFQKFSENKAKSWIDENKGKFQLTPEETEIIIEKVKEAQSYERNSYEQRVALAEIQKLMIDKLPAERGQKVKSWMRISMLFNPKTQVRNVSGNALIAPVNYSGDFVSSIVDKAISKKTGVRTIGNANIKAIIRGFKKGAYEATNDFKKGINTKSIDGNRFEISQGKSFSENNIIGKSLNRVEATLNYVMDVGDRVFSESWFENSLQNQMVLNNTTEVNQEMIDIATQEALSRTWNDNNNYTKFVLNIRKGLNKLNIAGYGLGDVLIPFAKTPANLTKAIVDYSPIGLINSLKEGINLKNSIEKGTNTAMQQHQFVQNLGKATAGTILYIVGYALANAGIIAGDNDEDKDVANFMKNTLGVSSYSIKIGDKTFTYDWAQPIAAPFAIMADLVKVKDSDAELYEKIIDVLDTPVNNILEQSFMSSIQTVFSNNDGVVSGIAEAIEELPARAIPTFVKQIADMVDGTQRQTYVKGKPIETAINKAKAKIPFVSKTLAPTVDTLGRESKKYGGNNNIFNVFFNPANFNTGLTTKSAKEIYKLYKQTGDKTIMPRVAGYSVTYDGKTYNLSTEERAKYQKIMGKYVNESVEELLSSKDYQKLENEQKAKIINEIISDGAEQAKEDYANTYNKDIKNKKEKIEYERSDKDIEVEEEIKKGLDISNAYIYKTIISKKESDKDTDGKAISSSATKNKLKYVMSMEIDDSQKQHLINLSTNDTDYNVSVTDLKKLNGNYLTYLQQSGKTPENGGMTAREQYIQLVNSGIPVTQLNKFYSEISDIEGQKDSNGDTISGSKKQAVFDYVNSLSLSVPQKQILLARQYESFAKLYYNDILNYIYNLDLKESEKYKIYESIFKKLN